MSEIPNTRTWAKLFKKTSTGAIQEWEISVVPAMTSNAWQGTIVTRYGQVGGAIQETRDIVKKGKNIGKKNETTALQQADAEAEAKWEKQLKKGYTRTQAEAEADATDEVIEGGVAPMLAHRFDEQGHKIVYPALAQPKFDGHRCICVIKDGEPSLWTRTRKPITGLPHLVKTLKDWACSEGVRELVLDGELYNHAYKDRFEELTSFIRSPEPKDGHEVVQYHIYDIVAAHLKQGDRAEELRCCFGRNRFKNTLVFVETLAVWDEDDLMLTFERFLKQGYEGLMVRNAEGLYVNKRSYDLQKVKEFVDAEFKVVGVEEGRGKLAGHAIFVCEHEGRKFKAKMKGETEALKKYWENPGLAVGRLLTIKYQGMTNKEKVPRFPVAMRFRADD